ncbi:HAMP domain-containing sensor histidine kinase [Nocardia mangyaensis]|uniref:HAMP domain-containing sensor histidine kinase n=1 Tax=Nocardia mangyaensis TaxID=2213200 RepID=UPI0026773192|nr:HAMP domain-containing sensor histidine kinase [Nocardia mangyaensis]MDO3649599.1 HAMP domain-containing sensor histidine kinase [Nocardia mangyaensis]
MSAARGSWSLRTRVAVVSAVVAALVAITLGLTYAALLKVAGSRQFDQTVSTMRVQVAQRADDVPGAPLSVPPLPTTPDPSTTITVPFTPVDTAVAPVQGAPGLLVRLDPDRDLVEAAITRSQLIGLGIGVGGVLVAAGLGWVLAGFAARPLRRLANATQEIDTLDELPPLSGRGAREAEELSDAINRMLARLDTAHGETRQALAGARDFAAVCAHELRTPLTAMRTDLQVLAGTDLPAEQRDAVLADVLAAERQIEHTLTDLERLAVGELTDQGAFESFELCETLDRAVQNARRAQPEVDISLTACEPVPMTGLPGGIMLIVTNAVSNAVHHGHATEVTVAARADADGIEITIDDNGSGIPEHLSPNAFDRFAKRPGSPGSGLGLALVRQQAELHAGTAELEHSPLGGVRLCVHMAQAPVSTGA